MVNKSLKRAAICLFIMLAAAPMRAEATITSVTVMTSRPYENADGYTYAEVTIHGSVARADGSLGRYSVPAIMIYPEHGRGNRVGVVDWLNSAFYHFFPPTTEFGTLQFTLLATGNYFVEEGYTYISIQWNKAVTEIFGPTVPNDGRPHNHLVYGSIDRSADAWEILRDAARLLKDPSVYPGGNGPYFKGSVDATDAFIPTTDADGHFAGGVRLPQVASTVHGRVAGAPLGRYAPLNPVGLDPFYPFVFLGGTFSRFNDDELLTLRFAPTVR